MTAVCLAVAIEQNTGGITETLVYKLLRDFSLPLLAFIWAIYSFWWQKRKIVSIRQVGDQYSDRIEFSPDSLTSYSVQVAITNNSPQATIVIAYYDIEPPWNEPSLEPAFDPKEADLPRDFYSVGKHGIQVRREEVLNHQRFHQGKLGPGDAFRGWFIAKGENPIPDDLKGIDNRWIDAKFVVEDTTGREYKSIVHLHF
jgi:hypothetical protein